jgi:hypothetical protein
VAVCCEHGDEPSGSMKRVILEVFLDIVTKSR